MTRRKKKDPRTTIRKRQRVESGTMTAPEEDVLVVEEPLEIRVQDEAVAVTMRTPGDDFILAAGFLFTEGLIHSQEEIGTIRFCENTDHPELKNIVNITPADDHKIDIGKVKRNFYVTSSCGICGKAAIENIRTDAPPLTDTARVKLDTLFSMDESLRGAQAVFSQTGGLHAAGLFDTDGTLVVLKEDIGRHNAVDKVIGYMLLQDEMPLDKKILMVSGRASFEICQKALMASIPIVCAVSAPSSLAVQFANESGMTLIGFMRGEEMNVYSGAGRIK